MQQEEAWLKRFPRFAAELKEFFANEADLDQFIQRPATSCSSQLGTDRIDYPAESLINRPRLGKGDTLGGSFKIHDVIEGGMAVVYIAESLTSQRTERPAVWALKTLHDFNHWQEFRGARGRAAERSDYEKELQLFRGEAMRWVNLGTHPHLIHAVHVLDLEGKPYIQMEYAEGGSLADRLRRGRPSIEQCLRWALQIATGLEYASTQHLLVHRDLKPANVLLDGDDVAKVTDFGLAKAGLESVHSSRGPVDTVGEHLSDSRAAGTVPYMAPEQFVRLGDTDVRSDIFSFGALVYELLIGSQLFAERPSCFMAAEDAPLVQPHEQRRDVPHEISACVMKCLEYDPVARHVGFNEVLDELRPICEKVGISTGQSIPYVLFSGSATDRYLRGRKVSTLMGLHEYAEAARLAGTDISGDSTCVEYWINKGVSHGELKQYEDARHCFNRAISIDGTNAKSWANLAFVFLNVGEIGKAETSVSHAVGLDEGCAEAWHAKGCCELLGERYGEAANSLARAWAINSHDWKIATGLAMSFLKLRKRPSAVKFYRRATELAPMVAETWRNFAVALGDYGIAKGQQESIRDSLVAIDQAIHLDPDDPQSWLESANLKWDAGHDAVEVLADLDEVQRRDPGNEDAQALRQEVTATEQYEEEMP